MVFPVDSATDTSVTDTTVADTPDASVTDSSAPASDDFFTWYIPRTLSLRTALIQSSNRVFVRLMRDLVQYHAARLPYDAQAVIADPDNPLRLRFLEESADQEAIYVLKRAYRSYRGLTEQETVRRLLRGHVSAASRSRAVLRLARQHGRGEARGLARPSRSRLDAGRRRRGAGRRASPRARVRESAAHDCRLRLPARPASAGDLVRRGADPDAGAFVRRPDRPRRRGDGRVVGVAVPDAQSQGAGSASQEAYRARRFRAHDALLAPDGIPVRAARSLADDRPRQLVGPAHRAGGADGHHRQ